MAVESDNWVGRSQERDARRMRSELSFKIVRAVAPFVVLVSLIQITAIVQAGDNLVRLVEPVVLAIIMSLVGLNAHQRLRRGETGK